MDHTAANLEFLRQACPEVVNDLQAMVQENTDAATSHDPITEAHVEPSRSGAPSLWVMPRGSSTARWLHSRFDPTREAKEQAAATKMQNSVEGVVLLGAGLLHMVEALIETYPGLRGIAVIDASPRVLETCLAHRDLKRIAQKRRLWLLTAPKAETLSSTLVGILRHFLEGDVAIVHHQPSYSLKPKWYDDAEEALNAALRSVAVDLDTSDLHSDLLQSNMISNIPAWLDASGADSLLGEHAPFRGRAAYLVGAGPSLDRDADQLAVAQQAGTLIMCAATCARQVIEAGCIPDLVCSLDPHKVSTTYLTGLTSESAPRLLAVSHATPDMISGHPWKFRFLPFAQEPLLAHLLPGVGSRASVDPGATAGHLMYDMARALGCDPIVLVAHDLAFPNLNTHGSGVATVWGGNRERLGKRLINLPRVDGMGQVPTLPAFAAFVTDFERRAKRDGLLGLRMINTSPAGALIAGFENMSLADAMTKTTTTAAPSAADLLDAAGAADQVQSEARRATGKAQLLATSDMLETLAGDLENLAETVAPQIVVAGSQARRVAAEAVLDIVERPTAALLEVALNQPIREKLRTIRAADTPLTQRAFAFTSVVTSLGIHARTLAPQLKTAADQISS